MKKILSLALALLLALFAFCGCGNKNKEFDYNKADLTKYVTLGKYLGIEVEVEDRELNDDDIAEHIDDILSDNAEEVQVKDRAVKDGDTIHLDYEGKRDGVAFDGGTAKDAELIIGSGSFIDGFEDGLIGVMPGETVDLDLKFPDPYTRNPELSGVAVVFTCTVNYIKEMNKPEWNDEFVKTLTNGDYETAAAYIEANRDEWAEEKKSGIDQQKLSDVWKEVLANAEIKEYPQSEIDKYVEDIIASYEQYATQYGMDLDSFLSMIGSDRNGLDEYADAYAHSLVAEELIYHSIVKDAGLELGEEEYDKGLQEYASYYNTTVDELKSTYGEDQIKDSLLWDKMCVYLTENAIEKPVTK